MIPDTQIAELKLGNTQLLWKSIGPALYTKRPLFSITVRELLQNSADAQRSNGTDSPVEFIVRKEADGWVLICRDNGIGMEIPVILEKFLALGESGKSGSDSVGGFGIAKASILGACSEWKLHTLDNHLTSAMLGKSPVVKGERINGTEITLRFFNTEEVQGLLPTKYAIFDAINYLATSTGSSRVTIEADGQSYTTELSGMVMDQKFRVGTIASKDGSTVANIYLVPVVTYKALDCDYHAAWDRSVNGKIVYRLNGLTQFIENSSSWDAQFNIVVDVQTQARPGGMSYPFTSSRESAAAWLRSEVAEMTGPMFTNYLTSANRLKELSGEKVVITKITGGTMHAPALPAHAEKKTRKERQEEKQVAQAQSNNAKLSSALTQAFNVIVDKKTGTDGTNAQPTVEVVSMRKKGVRVDESHLVRDDRDGSIKTMIRYLRGQKAVDVSKAANVKLLTVWTEIMDLLMDSNPEYAHPYGVGIVTDPDTDAVRINDNGSEVFYLFNPRGMKVSEPMDTVMNMIHYAAHELTHAKHSSHTEEFVVAYHHVYEKFLLKRGIKTIYALARHLRKGA